MLARGTEPRQAAPDGLADAKLAAVFSALGVSIEPKVGFRITVQFRYDTAKLGQPNTDPEGYRSPASGGESLAGLNGIRPRVSLAPRPVRRCKSSRNRATSGASEEYGRRLTMDAGAPEKGEF